MKSNYPDTPLAPVNLQAAKMLAQAEEPPDQSGFYLDLLEEAERLNKDILSMQGQLAAYKGEPNDWHRQCTYSLQRAERNLVMIQQSIQAVVQMSNNMRKMKQREENQKKHFEFALKAQEKKLEIEKVRRDKFLKHKELEKKAQLEKIKVQNEAELAKRRLLVEQGRAFDACFRSATRKMVGESKYLKILETAKGMLDKETTNETA